MIIYLLDFSLKKGLFRTYTVCSYHSFTTAVNCGVTNEITSGEEQTAGADGETKNSMDRISTVHGKGMDMTLAFCLVFFTVLQDGWITVIHSLGVCFDVPNFITRNKVL